MFSHNLNGKYYRATNKGVGRQVQKELSWPAQHKDLTGCYLSESEGTRREAKSESELGYQIQAVRKRGLTELSARKGVEGGGRKRGRRGRRSQSPARGHFSMHSAQSVPGRKHKVHSTGVILQAREKMAASVGKGQG